MFNQVESFLSTYFGLRTGNRFACPVSTVYVTEQFRSPKAQTREAIKTELKKAKQDFSSLDMHHKQPAHITSVVLGLRLMPNALHVRINGLNEHRETLQFTEIKLEKFPEQDTLKLAYTANRVIQCLRDLDFAFEDEATAQQAARIMIGTWNIEANALVNPGPTKFRESLPPTCPL